MSATTGNSRSAKQARRQLAEVHAHDSRSPRWFARRVGRMQVMGRADRGKARGWLPREKSRMHGERPGLKLAAGFLASLLAMVPLWRRPRKRETA